ncbi:hypothetical protein PghCCS26_18440 [Paenibacillus glycanilyticus]|uniref:Uncharacterized protein n=1 Tax=Paenibacillus glycanilyticus TaxID=126569 RepID=A0ABQ6NHX9_9BACL|nr:hypothetical protein PghCCS26_18440 [Paenibacillus glycanilyticus]
MFHYTVETTKTPDQAVETLTENLKAEKFGVLWKLDMQEKLREKGVEFDRFVIRLKPSVCFLRMH